MISHLDGAPWHSPSLLAHFQRSGLLPLEQPAFPFQGSRSGAQVHLDAKPPVSCQHEFSSVIDQ